MKWILRITLFLYLWAGSLLVNAQPPIFLPVPLLYDTVTSSYVQLKSPLRNINFPNVVSYSFEDVAAVAFRTPDTSKWIEILLPFNEPTNLYSKINVNNKGKEDWVIYGATREYGSGGGRELNSVMIISFDDEPMELFTADYSCLEESFGNRMSEGEGSYAKKYGYNLTFNEGEMIVKSIGITHEEWCSITPLKSGIYSWTEKGFRPVGFNKQKSSFHKKAKVSKRAKTNKKKIVKSHHKHKKKRRHPRK